MGMVGKVMTLTTKEITEISPIIFESKGKTAI